MDIVTYGICRTTYNKETNFVSCPHKKRKYQGKSLVLEKIK